MKKTISILICVMLLVGLMAGCGTSEKTAPADSETKAEQKAEEPVKAVEPKKEEVKPVKLVLMMNSPENTEAYNDMAKEYNKQFPNVTLDMTIIQNDYQTVLKAKLNSGDTPDMFMSSAYADNVLFKDYSYDLTNEAFIKEIDSTFLNGVTLDGKVIGYPFLVQAHSYIYNKKVFADAGITELPKTMKDYEEACKKLSAKGIQPFGTGFKEWWVLPQTVTQAMATAKDSYGGDYNKLIADMNSGKVKFGDIKEIDTAFDMLDMIKKYGGNKPMETDFNAQCSLLATGKVAMIHQGTWAEDTIKKINPDADIGFLAGPVGEDAEKAGIMVDSNLTFRVGKDAKNVKETLAWLNWLTTSEYGKAWIPEKVKQISPIKGAAAPKTQLAEETAKFLKEGKVYPWWNMLMPAGTEQPEGIAFQNYCAGKSRDQIKDELNKMYEKAAKAVE